MDKKPDDRNGLPRHKAKDSPFINFRKIRTNLDPRPGIICLGHASLITQATDAWAQPHGRAHNLSYAVRPGCIPGCVPPPVIPDGISIESGYARRPLVPIAFLEQLQALPLLLARDPRPYRGCPLLHIKPPYRDGPRLRKAQDDIPQKGAINSYMLQ